MIVECFIISSGPSVFLFLILGLSLGLIKSKLAERLPPAKNTSAVGAYTCIS